MLGERKQMLTWFRFEIRGKCSIHVMVLDEIARVGCSGNI